MERGMEFIIGSILCFIIAFVLWQTQHHFSGTIGVAILFFIYGVYKLISGR